MKLLERLIHALMDSKLDAGLRWMSVKLPVESLEEMASSGMLLSAVVQEGEHTAMAREFDGHPDGAVRRYWRRFGDFLVAVPHDDLLKRIHTVSEPHAAVFDTHPGWCKLLLEDARAVVHKVCVSH